MDLTWEEAKELANDKAEWHQRVAQYSQNELYKKNQSLMFI